MEAHFFDRSDPISVIGFLATLKQSCNTDGIHEGEAMWDLQFFVNNALSETLSSRMSAEKYIVPVVAAINIVQLKTKNARFVFSLKIVNSLFKPFAKCQAILEMNSAILRYT